MVTNLFGNLIKRNIKANIDDTVVKSNTIYDHTKDLKELRSSGKVIKLNLLKCTFKVALGKFLRFMVYHREGSDHPKQETSTKEGRDYGVKWLNNDPKPFSL